MKTTIITLALASVFLVGCGSSEPTPPAENPPVSQATPPAVQVAYDLGSIKKGDKAHCVVCAVKEGSTETEEVAETQDYNGKTYGFCNSDERSEFITNPSKFVGSN